MQPFASNCPSWDTLREFKTNSIDRNRLMALLQQGVCKQYRTAPGAAAGTSRFTDTPRKAVNTRRYGQVFLAKNHVFRFSIIEAVYQGLYFEAKVRSN